MHVIHDTFIEMPQVLIRKMLRTDVVAFITKAALPLIIEEYTGLLLVKTDPDPKHHAMASQMAAAIQQLADQDAALQTAVPTTEE